MTTTRNGLTKFGAFVRGAMIGLALNLSILPMVQAQQAGPTRPVEDAEAAPIDEPTATAHDESAAALSMLSDPEVRRWMAGAILEQTAEAERTAGDHGGVVCRSILAAESVQRTLFGKSARGEDLVMR